MTIETTVPRKLFTMRVSEAEKAAMVALALATGTTVSDAIRAAVRRAEEDARQERQERLAALRQNVADAK